MVGAGKDATGPLRGALPLSEAPQRLTGLNKSCSHQEPDEAAESGLPKGAASADLLLQTLPERRGPGSRASSRSSSLPLLTHFPCEEAAEGLVLAHPLPLLSTSPRLSSVRRRLLSRLRLGEGSSVLGKGCPWDGLLPLGTDVNPGCRQVQSLAGARSPSVRRPRGCSAPS